MKWLKGCWRKPVGGGCACLAVGGAAAQKVLDAFSGRLNCGSNF